MAGLGCVASEGRDGSATDLAEHGTAVAAELPGDPREVPVEPEHQLDLNAVLLDDELQAVKSYLLHCFQQPNNKKANEQLVFEIGGEVLSELYISKMTRLLFDEIIDPGHGYTFHSFRHSAANHLAIAWLGSKEMVMTYTDYSWQQARSMRKHLRDLKTLGLVEEFLPLAASIPNDAPNAPNVN